MKKLYRSRQDKMLFGLCGGIADLLNVDATLLRILLVVITVFTGGTAIFVYVVAGIIVPKEPYYGGFGPGPGGYNPGGHAGGWHNGGRGPHGHYGHHTGGSGSAYSNTPPFTGGGHTGGSANWQQGQSASNLDAMMDDLEKKALRREIDELKAKLAKLEKGDM